MLTLLNSLPYNDLCVIRCALNYEKISNADLKIGAGKPPADWRGKTAAYAKRPFLVEGKGGKRLAAG
jgi:hypothetical protein